MENIGKGKVPTTSRNSFLIINIVKAMYFKLILSKHPAQINCN